MTNQPLRVLLWVAVSTVAQAADERASLPAQEADQRALAIEHNWNIIDVLRVPGHSRNYKDINKVAADMLSKGIDAFAKLIEYINNENFDVLVVRDGSRFARTQALHSYVTETIIEDVGARIYSLADGWVDESNMRMWISMAGYSSAAEKDRLKQRYKIGMKRRFELKKPMASKDTWTHRKVRDERGNAVTYAIREDMRPLWEAVADDLLTGISYRLIAYRLADVHKFRKPNGNPFYDSNIHQILLNPITWGHLARGNSHLLGTWAFDESVPLPDGVIITRNTHPPLWTGQRALMIQTELRRRSGIARGRAWASRLSMFSGLIHCFYCGGRMTYHLDPDSGWQAYICDRRYLKKQRTVENNRRGCPSTKKSIQVQVLINWLSPRLNEVIRTGSLAVFGSTGSENESGIRFTDLERELESVESDIRKLTTEKIKTPADGQYLVQQLLDQSHARLSVIKATLQNAQRLTLMRSQSVETADAGVSRLQGYASAEDFFAAPSTTVNQIMHMILGKQKIVVKDGVILAIGYPPTDSE